MIRVGVGAVVIQGSTILLVKRANDPCRGYWAIPGGHIEYGESIGEAAIRELYEETSIRARPIGVVWVDEILPSECISGGHHYVIIDVLMKTEEQNPVPGTDAVEAIFYPIENIPVKTTPSTRRLIEYIKTHKSRLPLLPLR